MKKLFVLFLLFSTFFLHSCSVQEKIGIQQFVSEINAEYGLEMKTSDFILGKDNNRYCLFHETQNNLTSLSLSTNNFISGVSLLILPDADIPSEIDYFTKLCSVFTKNNYDIQKSVLNKCNITPEKIKFSDNNLTITVGKYNYTIISNTYSITLFCDKV